MAGHGAQELIVRAGNHSAGVVLLKFCQHASGQRCRVALSQRGGHGTYGQGFRRKRLYDQAQGVERLRVAVGRGYFQRRGGKAGRYEQRLAADLLV